MTNDFNPTLFNKIPIGLVQVNGDFRVLQCNAFARQKLGLEAGTLLLELVHPDSKDLFEAMDASTTGEVQIQFVVELGSIYANVSFVADDNSPDLTLVIRDISEQIALGTQLKKNKQPERKFIHDVSNLLTTTIGYAELINMMLEENEIISGERLTAVRRYEAEVFDALRRADELVKEQKQAGAKSMPVAIPLNRKHVMVVDDEAKITDFLTELLKARHYKVSAFNESQAAIDFYQANQKHIDLVILDQKMPDMPGDHFAGLLHELNQQLPIVLCAVDASAAASGSEIPGISHVISKPIDINELSKLVSNIID